MAKQIKQIRWFADGDKRNFPSTITKELLKDKEYLQQFSPILQLSIHTLPGTRILCNDQENNPIYIGHSGVYQLDLLDTTAVLWGIHFEDGDLDDIKASNTGLIIDLMYDNQAEDDSETETEAVITSTSGKASIVVNTNIKNIYKNIWYGVTDNTTPFVMTRDSQLEAIKAEFAQVLDNLKRKYEEMLAKLDPSDPHYPEQFAHCAECYRSCLAEIVAYYERIIQELEGEDSGSAIELAQGFRGANANKAVSQKALYELIERIQQAFARLEVSPEIELDDLLEEGND